MQRVLENDFLIVCSCILIGSIALVMVITSWPIFPGPKTTRQKIELGVEIPLNNVFRSRLIAGTVMFLICICVAVPSVKKIAHFYRYHQMQVESKLR